MTCKNLLWLALSTVILLSNPAAAYTDAEIEQIIETLRQDNAKLKEAIRELKATAPGPAQQIRTDPAKTKQKKLAAIRQSVKQQNELTVKGFLTAGATYADTAVADQNISVDDDTDFDTDTMLGLQTSFKLSDKTDITAQLIAKGKDDWNIEADWAFIRYQHNDNFSLRAGKLRLPLYLFSESLEVGFSYPWVRPPVEMYQSPLSTYEGMDATYIRAVDDWVHSVQVFTGTESSSGFKTGAFIGANATSFYDAWTFRISAYKYDLDILASERIPFAPFTNKSNKYLTAATMYDDGQWLFISEFSKFNPPNTARFFRDTKTGYITIGKYFGNWLPHITYAKTRSTNEPVFDSAGFIDALNTAFDFDPPIPSAVAPLLTTDPANFSGESYTLGLRYNVSANTSLKIEWAHYTDMDDTASIWNRLRLSYPNIDSYNFDSAAVGVDDINIYSIALDAVF